MNDDTAKIDMQNTAADYLCTANPEERELRHMFVQTLDKLFFATIRVDLSTDTAVILQSLDSPKIVSRRVLWSKHLERYSAFLNTREVLSFSAEHLLDLYRSGQMYVAREFPYLSKETTEWLTMTAFLDSEEDTPHATVIVRKSSGDHLLRNIVDLYVYSTCDFFIYLDAKNNSYTSFSRSDNGTPLPPAVCADYSAEIVAYANEFVVPEDREKVIREMGLARVLEKLEQQPTHSFTCGILDPVRGYTRKRLRYQYYNRDAQMIMLSRTDITDVYLENRKNQSELQAAKQLARMDPLTGLYNVQGSVEEITHFLESSSEQAALLFIDLDNFKSVNDTLGHNVGDDLLRKVAETLRANVRSCDLVGRIGGDEFLVFFQGTPSIQHVRDRAQRLCEAICRLSPLYNIPVSCSVGVAVSPEDGTDYLTLTKQADSRTYHAKAKGKNQVSID